MFGNRDTAQYEMNYFSTPTFCPACGQLIPRGNKTCPSCWEKLEISPYEIAQIRKHGQQVLSFSYGAYMSRSRDYTIRCRGDQCLISGLGRNGDMLDKSNTVSKDLVVKHVFEPVLALDWEENYKPAHHIFDGFSWGIHLDFEGREFHSSGYVVKPSDYAEVAGALERTLCRFLAYGDAGADENATGKEYYAILM